MKNTTPQEQADNWFRKNNLGKCKSCLTCIHREWVEDRTELQELEITFVKVGDEYDACKLAQQELNIPLEECSMVPDELVCDRWVEA